MSKFYKILVVITFIISVICLGYILYNSFAGTERGSVSTSVSKKQYLVVTFYPSKYQYYQSGYYYYKDIGELRSILDKEKLHYFNTGDLLLKYLSIMKKRQYHINLDLLITDI